jgi:hypothetical protein
MPIAQAATRAAPIPAGTAASVIISSLARHLIAATPVGPTTVPAPKAARDLGALAG